jgi:hypothetical protein
VKRRRSKVGLNVAALVSPSAPVTLAPSKKKYPLAIQAKAGRDTEID